MQISLLRWVRDEHLMPAEDSTIDVLVPAASGRVSIVLALPRLFKAMNKKAAELKFDIIQVCSLTILPLALYLAKIHGVPVVYDAYEYYAYNFARHCGRIGKPVTRFLEFLENMLIAKVAGVITVDSFEDSLIRRYRRFNPNATVLYNVPQLEIISPEEENKRPGEIEREKIYLAYVGGFSEGIGGRQILGAMTLVRERFANINLLLMGHTPEKDNIPGGLWHLAQNKAHIVCLPFLPQSDMMQYLRRAKLGFALYQDSEKYRRYGSRNSRKLFTYMAAGIPVIVSRLPLVADVVRETGCGLIVDETSPAAIAEAIEYIITHKTEAEIMGQRGRQAIEEKYNSRIEEIKFWQVYQNAFAGRKGRSQ